MFSVLLTLALRASASFGPGANKPVVSCESLATAALGPNVTVLSAVLTKTLRTSPSSSPAAQTCTYEDNVDVGDPSTIITHTAGLVDKDKCCALCFANPKCAVAAVLPASYGTNVGCKLFEVKCGGVGGSGDTPHIYPFIHAFVVPLSRRRPFCVPNLILTCVHTD